MNLMADLCELSTEISAEACRNCGRTCELKLRADYGHQVQECASCNALEFVVGANFDPAHLYSRDYFFGGEYANYDLHEPSNIKNFRYVLDRTVRVSALPSEARVLEVGAATGAFYRALTRHPHVSQSSYLGIEVSDYARAVARESGIEMLAPDDARLPSRIAAIKPNLIVALAVWEHVERPIEILDSIIELSGPEVTIVMSTVDAGAPLARWKGPKWRQYHPPTHLNYPTRKSLRDFLEDRKFVIREHSFIGSYRPLVEYTRFLGLKSDFRWGRRIMSFPLYLNTYDAQLIIAKRGDVR